MIWEDLINWVKLNHPSLKDSFLEGRQCISHISVVDTEIILPDYLIEMYKITSGQKRNIDGAFFLDMSFITQKESIRLIEEFYENIQLDNDLFNELDGDSIPKDAIYPRYMDYLRYPLAMDYGGNYIGIDYRPDTKGKVGQIINFGHDFGDRYVLAEDIEEFIYKLFCRLRDGRNTLVEIEPCYFEWRGKFNEPLQRKFEDFLNE